MKDSQSKLPVMHFEVPEEEIAFMRESLPNIEDGLTPVQRRLLFTMSQLDEEPYEKVYKIVGQTFQYHPYGDYCIYAALLELGHMGYLVDCLGYWGSIFTGDNGAGPRFTEGRLSRLAKEIINFSEIQSWKDTFDGLNIEPTSLPVLFPLLLAQGIEGETASVTHRILPHNFNELIDASIAILKNEPYELFPDFPTGGIADCSKYKQGGLGGVVKVRARIEKIDANTIVVKELPFGKTKQMIVESLGKAKQEGHIRFLGMKINPDQDAEIIINLPKKISANRTIEDIYRCTDCEVCLKPNACVIRDDSPEFTSVDSILRYNTEHTKILLGKHLEMKLSQLEDEWHSDSLVSFFVSGKVFKELENSIGKSNEELKKSVLSRMLEFQDKMKRPITMEDIDRLLMTPVHNMAGYETVIMDQRIQEIEKQMQDIQNDMNYLTEYAINWFQHLKESYGEFFPRKTEIKTIETYYKKRLNKYQ